MPAAIVAAIVVVCMSREGFDDESIQKIVWTNPVTFFGQSGRLARGDAGDRPAIDQTQLWEGNSVLRGQQPIVKR